MARETKTAVYAGSFNPFHAGHLHVLRRACALFDRVHVVVARNSEKPAPPNPAALAAAIAAQARAAGLTNAQACVWDGYVADFARRCGAKYLVRGVRNEADARQELLAAAVNAQIAPGLETILLVADPAHAQISSSSVRAALREQAKHFGDPQTGG